MDEILNLTTYLSNILNNSPGIIINYTLQAFTFTMAFTSLLTFILSLIKLSYATAIDNRLSQTILFILFLYIRVWGVWNDYMIILNMLGTFVIALYIYDFTYNLADACYTTQGKFRDLLMIVIAGFSFASLYGIYFSASKQEIFKVFQQMKGQNATSLAINQEHFFVYSFTMIILLGFLGIFRSPSFFHPTLMILVSCLITLLRYTAGLHLGRFGLATIPFQSLVYFIVAFDAEAKQCQRNCGYFGSGVNYHLLKFCSFFHFYSLLNDRVYHTELAFGVTSIMMLILGK